MALAQVNPTVGDLAGNAELVLAWARRAGAAGADLAAFPEMALTGHPVEDLALRASFVEASRRSVAALAARLAEDGLGGLPVAVGYLDSDAAGRPVNALAWLHGGAVLLRSAKHHLSDSGVFDEFRCFAPGDRLPVLRIRGADVAAAVCEDLWQDGGPVSATADAGAGLLLVLDGTPYERGADGARLDLYARRARQAGCALACVNLVGGQDELVFDGGSVVVAADGALLARAPRFVQHLLVTDVTLPDAAPAAEGAFPRDAHDGTVITIERRFASTGPAPARAPVTAELAAPLTEAAEVYGALVTGVRDYVGKNGFRSVVLGLSGGIDSALVATVAADALGPERVHAVLMPSRYSSEHSLSDAADLVERQGLHSRIVPINDLVAAYDKELALTGLAAENLQARIRGTVLMALSNQEGHLVLTTGNKSELAVGYSTLYGDSAGGFGPLKDLTKTRVWELSRWRNARRGPGPLLSDLGPEPIPPAVIDKEPSAELRPDQRDTDALPPYDVLDPLLDDYVERDLGRDALVAAGHDPALVERVIRLVDAAEHKRRQYPPGPKTSAKDFGRDRRLPITSRWRESR
ncbi:NH(3)-dependent NAD(+) synthetase [Actinocorallia herbida]|uniref:Glutamine-dependent NAD(+) synthetase n=1 Tax=Actinocorallia herbida TaxID=58109 RepID=A0A3N1CRF4_9ACTN|nr:NH(3)-dependent NAD(+) synthetase [Actinocorallia herbida]